MGSLRSLLRGAARTWRRAPIVWRGLQSKVRPIEHIRSPEIKPDADDPVSAITAHPEFQRTIDWFSQDPTFGRSLLSPTAQALLYSIIRGRGPAHVFEIGTFRAGTSEAIARAMHANGTGTLHTVDPFGMPEVPAILAKWPRALRRHVRFYPMDSMAFHMEATRLGLSAELILIDGHHDFEFALFDLHAAARSIKSRGFVVVDNINQPGPCLAVQDFLASNMGWKSCGGEMRNRPLRPFDRERAPIANTEFLILRAPPELLVGLRPVAFGVRSFGRTKVSGVKMTRRPPLSNGTLSVQCVFRGLAQGKPQIEILGGSTTEIDGHSEELSVPFKQAIASDARFDTITVEPILVWNGPAPLVLAAPPEVF